MKIIQLFLVLLTFTTTLLSSTACDQNQLDQSADNVQTGDKDQYRSENALNLSDIDVCEKFNWYNDGVCDEFCKLPDSDCFGSCSIPEDCAPIDCGQDECPQMECNDSECEVAGINCPVNSSLDGNFCYCNNGYHVENNTCVADQQQNCPNNAHLDGGECSCNSGYYMQNGSCHIFELKNGDIVFHESSSSQSQAIKLATHSDYSHIGIVFINSRGPQVLEAVQPVKITAYNTWVNRGIGNKVVVKRLHNASQVLTTSVTERMLALGKRTIGLNYDIYFGWSDSKMYCSELVWKLYDRAANIQIGALKKLRDFDLSHPAVQRLMKKRYGTNIPYDETVISPQDIFESNKLITVFEN